MEEFDDDDFRKSLKKVVSSDRLPDQICRAIRLDNESRLIKPNKLREFVYKLNRVALKWLCDFNRVNLVGVSLMDNRKRRLSFRQKLDRLLNDKTRKTSKRWPTLVLVVYLLFAALASYAGYYLYIYDANNKKLQKLQECLNDPEERDRLMNRLHLDVERLKRDFEHRANQAREILGPLAGDYIEWTFISECILVLCTQALDWFLGFPMSHQVGSSVWLSVQAILNQDDEHRTRYELILNELEHFQRDSLLFAGARRERFSLELARALQRSAHSTFWPRLQRQSSEAERVEGVSMAQHRCTMEQLKFLALDGRLNPFNRTPMGRDKLALVCLVTYLSFNAYCNLTMIVGNHIFWGYFQAKPSEVVFIGDNILGFIVGHVGIWFLIETGIIAATLMTTIMTLTAYDQIEASESLRAWVCHVINRNELRCSELLKMATVSQFQQANNEFQLERQRFRHLVDAMELDHLMIIVHCRLTMRTFSLVRKSLKRIAFMAINFAISIPLVFCIHSAYFRPELKLVTLSCCLATTLSALSSVALLGLLYRRSIRAFGTIWTLVAQLSYYESVPSVNKHLRLDSSITLFILRRQLADMQFTMDKFTIRWLTLPITYINLFRIFSWIILFIMAGSILSVGVFGDGLGSILADPFGLFKFLRNPSSV